MTISVTRRFGETKGLKGRRQLRTPEADTIRPTGRLPRVTKLMALAIRFDQLLRDGVVKDQAEIARLGLVTRARVTQIMNLLNLAPEIQAALLHLPSSESGRDQLTERLIRRVLQCENWFEQRLIWRTFIVAGSR